MLKIQHLEMIQRIITRMADNSFKIKGWVITIIAALAALSVDKTNPDYLFIGMLPVIGFWYLDAFYLRQERLFRKLYNDIAGKEESEIDFCMNTQPYIVDVDSCVKVMFSRTLRMFYAGLILVIYLATKVA